MALDSKQILDYWNQADVESMYDKHLLRLEIELIKEFILQNSKILDAGCGEGEATVSYASVPGVTIHAADFSETRLKMAEQRLKDWDNVTLKQVDFLGTSPLDTDYDVVISQRFLINMTQWLLQQKVLLDLMAMLKPGGILLMLEGSKQGTDSLNEFRIACGLKPIPIKWHNLFIDDDALVEFMGEHSYSLITTKGLGTYFLLTRGIRPLLDRHLNWDAEFNQLAATKGMHELLGFDTKFSRLKLWVFQK